MEYIDIFDDRFKVSYYRNIDDTTSTTVVTLRAFLQDTTHKDKVLHARSLQGDDYRNYKKHNIPNCTVGCTCFPTRTNANATPNGLICIDVDGKDNPNITDWELFKEQVSVMPQVAYCALSIGGNGVYIIEPIAYPDKFTEQYKQLEIDFLKAGVVIDKQCCNIARARFMSYDEHPYINHAAIPYNGLYQEPKTVPRLHTMSADATQTERKVAEYCDVIKRTGLNLTKSYNDWIEIGMALADLGENGRQYYHIVSAVDNRYKEVETDKKFNNFLQKTRNIHIGTFFTMCHDAGIDLRSHTDEPQQTIAPKGEQLPTDKEKAPQIENVSQEITQMSNAFQLEIADADDVPDNECLMIPIYDEHLQPTKGTHRYPLKDLPQWIVDNPDTRLFSYWDWSGLRPSIKTIALRPSQTAKEAKQSV